MTSFQFRALDSKGELIEGEIEASDPDAVVGELRRRQQMPLAIHPAGAPSSPDGRSSLRRWLEQPLFGKRGIAQRDVAVMTRELATLLNARLTVDQCLSFLLDVAPNEAQRRLITDLLEKVQGGSTLATALEGHKAIFSNAYVSLVRAGESGNALDDVLARLAQFLDRNQRLTEQVKSALVYPIMLMIMAAVSIVVLLALVVPQFTPLFESAGAELPPLTRLVVGLGDVARDYWWLGMIGTAGLLLGVGALLQNPTSRARIDRATLKLPLIGELIAKIDTSRLASTLGTLLANGVALPEALTIARETMGNALLREKLGEVQKSVKEGGRIAASLAQSGAFPKLATHLIAVGERSGQLETMLLKIAEIFEQEAKTTIERLMTLLVPVLTIAVGLVIATIIGAILTAILAAYQLPL
ncbi:MAG: type II secretion system F family protein [Geminicoccaceae bacterium]